MATILRALSLPSSRGSLFDLATRAIAPLLASSITCEASCSLASLDVIPAIRSNWALCWLGRLLELVPDEGQLVLAFLQLRGPRVDPLTSVTEVALRLR